MKKLMTRSLQSDAGHSHGAGTPSSSPSNAVLAIEPDIDPDGSVTLPLVQVQGRYETVPVWEDEEDVLEEEEKEKWERWDEASCWGVDGVINTPNTSGRREMWLGHIWIL